MAYIGVKDTGLNSLSHKGGSTEPSFTKSSYSLQNNVCFSQLTFGLESFGHKSTPSDSPWIEAYCPKI